MANVEILVLFLDRVLLTHLLCMLCILKLWHLPFSNQIWVMALSVCFIFTITIGTFPAVTVEVQSSVAKGGAWGRLHGANQRLHRTRRTHTQDGQKTQTHTTLVWVQPGPIF